MAEVGDWGLGWLVRVAEEGARAAVKVDVGARATGDGGLRWSRRRRCEAERRRRWHEEGRRSVGRKRRHLGQRRREEAAAAPEALGLRARWSGGGDTGDGSKG